MTIAEQIAAWKSKRAAKVVAMTALTTTAETDPAGARVLTQQELEAFQGHERECQAIDAQLSVLSTLEARSAEQAVAVQAAPNTPAAQRGPTILVRHQDADDAFPGQAFTRKVIAMAAGRVLGTSPVNVARQRWGKTNPKLVEVIHANEVPAMGSDAEYGTELVTADSRFTGDFITFLYGRTIYDRLNLRVVPANVTIKGQDTASQSYWVGERAAIPLTVAGFMDVSLTAKKQATIAVLSNELLRDSSPAAELLVRDSLVQSAAQLRDGTFLGSAAVTSARPAGIFNGVTALGSNGLTADNIRQDLQELLAPFIQNKAGIEGLTWLMNPLLALAVSMMTNSLSSAREFPGVSLNGGTLEGLPLLTGDNVPTDVIALISPQEIWRIGERGIEVSLSRDASLEMSSAPTGDSGVPTGASLVSMFQTESTAIKLVQPINFQKRRTFAAQWMTDAHYGETGTVTG